ncbi:MAG: LysR family transcriptional regulator [Asticcacaulis sp.]|uniref:LysR family transcriptional regulator n=1 Tax=Asticcacaulis sp. TaxID=1872648 RepID=UPI003F7BD4A4
MDSINLNRLAYFAAVVDTGSFTRAAERLGITKAVVSQQVARLEAELRTSLLSRTTRRVEPTEAGRLFHARCLMILREAEDAVGEMAEVNAAPMGLLRIAAPTDYGALNIAPVAAEFVKAHPACTVDLMLSDNRLDLVAHQIDVAIRVGWLDDSSLQARRIGSFRQLLVACPEFAAASPVATPADLAALAFIAHGGLRDPLSWHFAKGDFDRQTVHLHQVLTINSTPGTLSAALAGGGLAVLPDYLAQPYVTQGALVHVLPEWSLPSGGIHAVYPAARFRPAKVSAFVSLLSRAAPKLS